MFYFHFVIPTVTDYITDCFIQGVNNRAKGRMILFLV